MSTPPTPHPTLRPLLRRLPWSLLTAGWLAAFAVGLALALALQAVGWWERGAAWERQALVLAHRTVAPYLDPIFLYLPLLGTNYSLVPIIAIAALWLWRRGRPTIAIHLAVVQLGSALLNPALKLSVPRPRPDLFELRGQYALPAFPSGHSIATASVLFTVAYLVHRTGHGAWAYWAWGAYFLLNSYSRLYLSVHWPTDLVAGTLVGLIWLGTTLRAFRGFHP